VQLTPKQAAALANSVYQVKDIEPSLFSRLDLQLPKNFAVGSKVSGSSGLGPGTLSGFGFVATGSGDDKNETIVALRGTDSLHDWLTDGLIGFGVAGPTGTSVHTGFNRTWKTLKDQIDRALPSNQLAGTTVHCVGHSLGGALAALTADHLSYHGAKIKLHTFGSPRVGMIYFAKALTNRIGSDNIFRVYHPADPVPMIPLFPFTHTPIDKGGYALACSATERISPSAHKMKDSYIPLVGNQSYATLAANGSQTLSSRQIESWLRRVKNGGWIQNYGARATEMVGIALEWVLDKILEGAMIGLQPYVAAGVGILDTLAYVLHAGVKLVKDVAWYVEAIVLAILKLVGYTVTKGVPLTLQFIRWVLEKMYRELVSMAKGVVGQN
jgi:triacylglycerol lipase